MSSKPFQRPCPAGICDFLRYFAAALERFEVDRSYNESSLERGWEGSLHAGSPQP
jgi:hypothetical protein